MKRFLSLLIFCLLAMDVSAATQPIITAIVTITNQTVFVTNGQTITINGTTRTWTNIVTSAQTQIQQTNSSVGCVTNLFLAYAIVPATGINISYSAASSNVTFQSFAGLPLTIALSPGWASLGLSTNNIGTNTLALRGPPSMVGNYERTNAANDISLYLTDPAETNQWGTNAVILLPWYQLIQSLVGGGIVLPTYANTNLSNLSPAGLAVIQGAIGSPTNSIASNSGNGTNINLYGTTTILGLPGTTTALIPVTGSTISGSSFTSSSHMPIYAFTNFTFNGSFGSSWANQLAVLSTNWIQYQFPSPVAVGGMIVEQSGDTAPFAFQSSPDGVNWTTLYGTNSTQVLRASFTNTFPITTAAYWRWSYSTPGNGAVQVYGAQLYAASYASITSSAALFINTPVGFNTNAVNGNEVEVNGTVDATGYKIGQINLLTIIANANSGQKLFASGGTSGPTQATNTAIFNGFMDFNGLNAWTNETTTAGIVLQGTPFANTNGSGILNGNYMVTNVAQFLASFTAFTIGGNPTYGGVAPPLYYAAGTVTNQYSTVFNWFSGAGSYPPINVISTPLATYTNSTSPAGLVLGLGIGTNTASIIQAGVTNVALIGATSLTVYFTTGFADTNWFPTMVEAGGTAIPALAFTAITTNSFSTSMTALTFSGGLWFTGTHRTQ